MKINLRNPADSGLGLSSLQAEVAHKMVSLISAERWSIGDRLSDVAISKELRVSRTPVRQVLNLLVQQGIVSQTPNRGYQLHRIPAPNELKDSMLPPSEAEELYRLLMSSRASGVVGAEVSEAELADRLGATRSAVRRVLMRFAAEGLAERLPGHGWRFAESLDNERAVSESYTFRLVIECGALLQPDYAPDLSQLAALQREQIHVSALPIHNLTRDLWFNANANFHETIVSWANNRFLTQSVRWQNHLRRMTEYSDFDRLGELRIRRACSDHLSILEAIVSEDLEFAAALLRRHISRSAAEDV
ncbi:GntR family transcriptional regulator [Brucella sp. NM4]|uniref:GntR family transcriptional regulator n=1 Tax=Brucella/Ochrobactrum group TaxID=2826938 RepID=UPI0017FDAAB3|nr:GntR family transcriptional regulator [Brucella sp. NM4]MBA8822353.1 DNA-binding GntR family transcriptional regulator [Ochrobactrum sp. P6BSIII]WHS30237.1 GntR family transcriptional regulator [Brucella sp. NM4]WHT44280.1 GntR family transcriptional regulator [Ochrobactrum sp. SSR]